MRVNRSGKLKSSDLMYCHMSFIFSLLRPWTISLWIVSMALSLFLATPAMAKPKFFICPTGMTRDATAVTENFQVNLCSKNLSEISIVAMRNIKTKKQMNLAVNTTDDIVYTAKNRNTTYRFDFNKRTLTIQTAPGKKTVERIISSD
jgi:hypothetical protein